MISTRTVFDSGACSRAANAQTAATVSAGWMMRWLWLDALTGRSPRSWIVAIHSGDCPKFRLKSPNFIYKSSKIV